MQVERKNTKVQLHFYRFIGHYFYEASLKFISETILSMVVKKGRIIHYFVQFHMSEVEWKCPAGQWASNVIKRLVFCEFIDWGSGERSASLKRDRWDVVQSCRCYTSTRRLLRDIVTFDESGSQSNLVSLLFGILGEGVVKLQPMSLPQGMTPSSTEIIASLNEHLIHVLQVGCRR